MAEWKKSIFVSAIKIRVSNGEGTAEEIINFYTKLTEEERGILKAEFSI